jgi:hypothetical protein
MARVKEIVVVLVLAGAGCGDDAVVPGDESTGGSTDGPNPSTSASASSASTSASTTGVDTEGSSTTMEDETSTSTSTSTSTESSSSGETTESSSSSETTETETSTTTGPDDCGNDTVEDAEQCDGIDLAGNDCTTIGYPAGGELSCANDCTFDASGCFGPLCGDDVIDEPESCDGLNLAGNDCEVLGYDGGILGCTDTCILDESGCFITEFLQNDNGNCGFTQVGCSDDDGTSGNPQDLLECYTSNLAPPIEVAEVEYFLGGAVPLPDALDLVVHAWDGPGNAPGTLLGTVVLDPMVDIVAGGHILVLPTPIANDTAGFCIGFHGEDPLDGFRVEFTDADATVGESWILAEACGAPDLSELSDLLTPGNYCIRPTVHGH